MSSLFQQSVADVAVNHDPQLRNNLTGILFEFDFVCDGPIH